MIITIDTDKRDVSYEDGADKKEVINHLTAAAFVLDYREAFHSACVAFTCKVKEIKDGREDDGK